MNLELAHVIINGYKFWRIFDIVIIINYWNDWVQVNIVMYVGYSG